MEATARAETPMFMVAYRLTKLRETKKEIEENLKSINEQIKATEQELAQLMLSEEIQNFVRGDQMFYLTTKTYASAVAERKPELLSWLKENGYGDLVQETVNAQTLSAWVREQLEENEELPEDLKSLVNVYEETTVGVRKAPAKGGR